MHTTSPSLLERLRIPREGQAWERFVDLYSPLIFQWARQTGLQEADAADIVQEMMASIFHLMPQFQYRPGRSFRGWLFTLTRNKSVDQLRKNFRLHSQPIPQELSGNLPDPGDLISEEEYRTYLLRRTLEWMRTEFPSPSWEICWQHVVEAVPAHEVASNFGVTTNYVYLTKSRIFRRLRQELAGLLDSTAD
jgi:RNA polymerase sigma-70 factor (ECF subfamily)